MADATKPMGWYEFRDYNIREVLESLEARGRLERLKGRDETDLFVLSGLNALREGYSKSRLG